MAASMATPSARSTRFHIGGVTMRVMAPCAPSTADSRPMAARATSLRPPAMPDSTTTSSSSHPPAGGAAAARDRLGAHTQTQPAAA